MADAGHVVLVGLMGSGKSTVGKKVAKLLGRPFVDADVALVDRTGRTVALQRAPEPPKPPPTPAIAASRTLAHAPGTVTM